MKAIGLVCSLWLSAILSGCGQRSTLPPPDQMRNSLTIAVIESALNEQRAKLGLRPISVHWVLYRSLPTQDDWKIHKDGLLAKTVFKDASGNASSEEDYYYSGAEFTDREGHGWERITVHVDYGSKEAVLSYTGTNKVTEGILSKYLMPVNGPSTDVSGVMAAVKAVAMGWPDGPK